MADDMDFTLLPYLEHTNRLIAQEGGCFYELFCHVPRVLSLTGIHLARTIPAQYRGL